MLNCNPINTQWCLVTNSLKSGLRSSLYRSVVGALHYANITCHELSFAVNKVCQFMVGISLDCCEANSHILKGNCASWVEFPTCIHSVTLVSKGLPSVILTGLQILMKDVLLQVLMKDVLLQVLLSTLVQTLYLGAFQETSGD